MGDGFLRSLIDVIFDSRDKAEARVGGLPDFFDRVLESLARRPGTAVWRDMKWHAEQSLKSSGGGRKAIKVLLEGNAKRSKPLRIHFVGHSPEAILIAYMLDAMNQLNSLVESCSLMAPACMVDLFKKNFHPKVRKTGAASGIKNLFQYNLIDQHEEGDSVGPYRKSLVYFVSFSVWRNLSMKCLSKPVTRFTMPSITDSEMHGGFDNDRKTMNDILKNVLGKKPSSAKRFQPEDVKGY